VPALGVVDVSGSGVHVDALGVEMHVNRCLHLARVGRPCGPASRTALAVSRTSSISHHESIAQWMSDTAT